MAENFEAPKDPVVKGTALIAFAAIGWLIFCSRAFRDVNAS